MNKKSQVLIIILWILLILTVLTVNIGHRVSMALRLSLYQRDRLKAVYLAKAGVNLAITEIMEDNPDYDTLIDGWANNEEVFKKITLSDNNGEFATVSFTELQDDRENTIYGVVDEERKININLATKELLVELINITGVTGSLEIANNICAWRGDVDVFVPDYQDLGYPNKSKKFSNIEELILVKDVTADIYNSVKELITSYPVDGDGRVNINTSSQEILTIIANTASEDEQENYVDDVVNEIINIRNDPNRGPFKTLDDVIIDVTAATDEDQNLFNNMKIYLTVKSDNFKILARGNVNKTIKNITSVYKRNDNKIIYWHED